MLLPPCFLLFIAALRHDFSILLSCHTPHWLIRLFHFLRCRHYATLFIFAIDDISAFSR